MTKQNTETPNNNGANFAQAAADDQSAQALTERALKMLSDLDAEVRTGIDKVERKHNKLFEAAFAMMYMAIVAIEESGGREAFLASRGIRANGRIKNHYFLMVRAFADSTCAQLQGSLCKKAQVIQLARMEDVKPNDFEKWKRLWPIERACEELRRRTNSPRQQKKNGSETKLDTRGLTGEHPVLVFFSPNSRPRLVRLLSNDDLLRCAERSQHDAPNNAQTS